MDEEQEMRHPSIIEELNREIASTLSEYKSRSFYPALFETYADDETKVDSKNLSSFGSDLFIATLDKETARLALETAKISGSKSIEQKEKTYKKKCEKLDAMIERLENTLFLTPFDEE